MPAFGSAASTACSAAMAPPTSSINFPIPIVSHSRSKLRPYHIHFVAHMKASRRALLTFSDEASDKTRPQLRYAGMQPDSACSLSAVMLGLHINYIVDP